MNDEKYYPALKKLSLLPEWKVYEEFLNEELNKVVMRFMDPSSKDLNHLQSCAIQIREIKISPKRLIAEVEEVHKRRNQK